MKMQIEFLDNASNYRIMDNIRKTIVKAAFVAKEVPISPTNATIERLINTRHQQLQRMYSLTFIIRGISRKCADQLVRHKGLTCVMSSSMYTKRQGDESYDAAVAECGTDEASYKLPLSFPVDLMVHGTIWEIKHVVRARRCQLNTAETIDVVSKLAIALHGLDPIVFSLSELEPYCKWQNRGEFRCPESLDGSSKCGKYNRRGDLRCL